MALAGLEVLAVVAGLITTVPLLGDLFAAKPDDSITTVVKIVTGDDDFTDGHFPGIQLFDRQGQTIGLQESYDDVLGKGAPRTANIVQIDPLKSAGGVEYISLSQGGNDAICISFFTVRTPTDLKYSWTGDIAFQCAGIIETFWYHGNVVVSQSEKGIIKPKCAWIDGDSTNGITTKGLGIHLPSFIPSAGREKSFRENIDRQCKSQPRFAAYTEDGFSAFHTIPFFKEDVFDLTTLEDFGDKALDQGNWDLKEFDTSLIFGRDVGNSTAAAAATANPQDAPSRGGGRRPRKTKQWRKPGQLIKSKADYHSARELCESPYSFGPDMVNLHEGIYCDMTNKQMWDVCKDDSQRSCFDIETSRMRLGGGNSRRDESSGRLIPRKIYDEIKEW
ncbi:uncharacterized protein DNG_09208 [Cephalotrichum gorgonifer]|uniref:Uncharacterized protein n=1 Tax=Cephalotrichum gorgonifer TaxID=2041049 RepID=A0AAE8N7C2_9PEZI|nr:uncharacterized protein DNG_09208 [Cephalotrichum gorgonifer]